MNEEERSSQVSALFDGELDPGQSNLVIRRLLKDPALRTTWSRYAMIGASLRQEPLSVPALGREDVASRVAAALAAEPELTGSHVAASPARQGWTSSAAKALWGSALAASVAAASILVLRMQAISPPGGVSAPMARVQAPLPTVPVPGAGGVVAAAASNASPHAALVADTGPAPSYTTPVVNGNATALPAPLVNYVVAHSEYLTPVMRFNPLSAVMNGSFEGDELVEATEAEIGAARR